MHLLMNMGDNTGKDAMERVELLQDIFASVLASKIWSQTSDSHQHSLGRRRDSERASSKGKLRYAV